MARDHRKLESFTTLIGLRSLSTSIRRTFRKTSGTDFVRRSRKASVSIPTNIVEGSARRSTREYLNFLDIARASGGEVAYLVQLTYALDILSKASFAILDRLCEQVVPQLEALVDSVERLWLEERKAKRAKAQTRSRTRTGR
jgi:four helix bundle protein